MYANIRPSRSRADLTVLREPMDLIIVRENTEGFYSDRNMLLGPAEFMPDEDSAFSLRKVTATACSAVARVAFELARDRRHPEHRPVLPQRVGGRSSQPDAELPTAIRDVNVTLGRSDAEGSRAGFGSRREASRQRE